MYTCFIADVFNSPVTNVQLPQLFTDPAFQNLFSLILLFPKLTCCLLSAGKLRTYNQKRFTDIKFSELNQKDSMVFQVNKFVIPGKGVDCHPTVLSVVI